MLDRELQLKSSRPATAATGTPTG